MVDQEFAERLIRLEEREKSNTHRLNKVEVVAEEIHTMSETMVQLIGEVKHTNETVSELKEKVEEMEDKPSARLEQIKSVIIAAVASAIISGFIGAYFF